MTFATLDLRDPHHLACLHALQLAAYGQEAKLLDCWDLPPLKETLPALAASGDRVTGLWEGPRLLAAVAFRPEGDGVEIRKLMVDPSAARQGLATRLLADLFKHHPARSYQVATGAANVPAVSLYLKAGFEIVACWRAPEGLHLIKMALLRPCP